MCRRISHFCLSLLLISLVALISFASETPKKKPIYKTTILRNLGNVRSCMVGGDEPEAKAFGHLWGRPYRNTLLKNSDFHSVSDISHVGWGLFTLKTPIRIIGDIQVGEGVPNGTEIPHALLWHGTPESVTDLHPAGFDYSSAFDTSGDLQVGIVGMAMPVQKKIVQHASVWNGTATSFVDLHDSLIGLTYYKKPISPIYSFARSVDKNGNIVGEMIDETHIRYAVLWTKTSEAK
jgi:hypothetical protein